MPTTIKQLLHAAAGVLMPRRCPVCDRPLAHDEQWVCRDCMSRLPRTHFEQIKFNRLEQLFAGKTPVEHATAYFFYEKTSSYAALLHDFKYHDMPGLGLWLAERAATDIDFTTFYGTIDCVVPVPLHFTKEAKRGYNQSERIAQGIARVTGATVEQMLYTRRAHSTQTHKDAYERMMSAKNLYETYIEADERLRDKHCLLVDDVVTTGATLLACAEALNRVEGIKVSIFALAAARLES